MKIPSLSARESEILKLAAAGQTDVSIAHSLGITVPTVGTYWNRIRSKIGSYSRTEIVAIVLRAESDRQISEMRLQYQELLDHPEVPPDTTPWKEILVHAPDAIIVVDEEGTIRQANNRAEEIFGYQAGELNGRALLDLVPSNFRAQHKQHVREYVRNPKQKRMAEHRGTNAVRKDGEEFAIAADINGFSTQDGVMVACVIRRALD